MISTTFPVYVYGNGDFYRELFNSIVLALGDKGYKQLIIFVMVLSATWAMIRFSAQRSAKPLIFWIVSMYVALNVFLFPESVEVFDLINDGKAYTIDNVPFGFAVVASYVSRLGAGLTQIMEKNFSTPDDLKYGSTGMVMASRIAMLSTQFQVTNPNFRQSLQSFTQQCVFYDLLLNKYSLDELASRGDIWQFISSRASPARSFMYTSLQGASDIETCQAGAAKLSNDWKTELKDASFLYGSRIFPEAANPQNQLLNLLPQAYSYLSLQKIAGDATTLMQQNMMMNVFGNSLEHMSTSTNAPAALEAYALAKAQMQKRLTNQTVGEMAAYWLPIMRNVLLGAMYGSFIFIFLALFFSFGTRIFQTYVVSLFWLQLWAPIYAILNLFLDFYAQIASSKALLLANGQASFSLSNQMGLAQVNSDVAGLAGYLSLSTPLLAWGIIKGMGAVFSQAAQYIAGVTQGAASSASGEASSGNLSLGNVSYQNSSAFNTSANHFDTNAKTFSGMVTNQMAGGSTLSIAPDGTAIMNNQSAISNLGSHINIAESLRASYMKQADNAETASFNQAKAYAQSTSEAMRSMYELSGNKGFSTSSGEGWSYSDNASVAQAMNNVNRLTHQFAEDHKMSYGEAASVLTDAYANGSAGIDVKNSLIGRATGIGAGANLGFRHSADHRDSTNSDTAYAQAQNYVQDTSFAQNADTVLRAAHDHSLRSSNEQGQRLIDNMGTAYDKAQTARSEAVSSYNSAQSYREMASYAEDNAVTINTNGGQVLMQRLQAQGMTPTQIENLMTQHPEQAQAVVQAAMQDYAQSMTEGWSHGMASDKAVIEKQAHLNNQTIDGEARIDTQHQQEKMKLETKAKNEGLAKADIVDREAKSETENLIAKTRAADSQDDKNLKQKESKLATKVKSEQSKKRHGSLVRDFFKDVDTKDN